MIVIKVELWPHGDRDKAEKLGQMYIANDGTGTPTRGNYWFKLFDKSGRIKRKGEVKDFARKRFGVWKLLELCLTAHAEEEE